MADDQVSIRIDVLDLNEARELEALLAAGGAEEVEIREPDPDQRGIAFIPIVVAAVIGVTALVDIYERWRKNHMPQETIDAREKGEPVITINREIRDGRIIVLLPEGKIEIHEVPAGVNVGDLIKAALTEGAAAVKAAAEKIGAKVSGPDPIND